MKRTTRIALGFAAVAALALPAGASAGPLAFLAPVVSPLYHVQEGTYTYEGQSGSPQAFTIVGSDLSQPHNGQLIRGTFGGAPFVAMLEAAHDYDKKTDDVDWVIKGSIDPSGSAPPMPLTTGLEIYYDREKNKHTFTLQGTIAGQPFTGVAGKAVTLPGA